MPGRLLDMENPGADTESRATRRRSTRDKKQVTTYGPAGSATKRKRGEDGDDVEDIDMEDTSDENEEEDDGEPDEEEMREKRRRSRRRASKSKQPAAKKSRKSKAQTNGAVVDLAIRPATTAGKKAAPPKKKAKQDASAESAGGIYADVFARGKTYDDAATDWLGRFREHEARAIAEVFNFVLKCSGCNLTVDEHEAQDPDHFPEKLRDIQDEYQAQNVADYPIIARGKAALSFRNSIRGFFDSLIQVLATSGVLYEQPEVMENIEAWVGTMSSAANRPFRHTATVVSLAIVSDLAELAAEVVQSSANFLRMSEAEKKKKSVNRGRAKELEDKVKENNSRREKLDEQINAWFETVFLHRYRDVDPKIRVDCVQALGHWILTYPDYFFDGQYLRYLGWVLSDLNAPTRLEVVKELQKLYEDNDRLAGLKTFTERFRTRIVEIATRDVDPNVRAATVELLDTLREAGLLEPDDIDSVGRLIFDSEPSVRNSVVAFFTQNINDQLEVKVDELGGDEALEEAGGGEEDENYDSPRIEWLRLKCLVELLEAYSSEDGDLPSNMERWPGGTEYTLVASGIESKFSVAAQSLYNSVDEIKLWRILAGYILYDHSRPVQNGAAADVESIIRTNTQLDAQEEVVLLEVLNAAVKMDLSETAEAGGEKKSKMSKKDRDLLAQKQEDAARDLAAIIPRLLKKFGAQPEPASAVLRLEHVLNPEIFQELRQDSTTFAALLDDINKQFLTHGDESVLAEASAALLHARRFDDLGEVTAGKMQELWQDTTETLHKITRGKDVSTRGSLANNVLTGLSNTVLRLSNLAKISECTEQYELAPRTSSRKGKSKARASNVDDSQPSAIRILTDILRRGPPTTGVTPETDALEDALVSNAIKAVFFYLIWKIQMLRDKISKNSGISGAEVEVIAQAEDDYISGLTLIIQKRKGADDLRLEAAGYLLDLHCALASLRHARISDTATQQEDEWTSLIAEVDVSTQAQLRELLGAAERAYAKKIKKRLAAAVDDEDEPLSDDDDDDEEPEDDEESDEEDEARREAKILSVLLAEQRLCELTSKIVLGIMAGVVDGKEIPRKDGERDNEPGPMRKRLERNKGRLGQNFKKVVEFLDQEKKQAAKAARSAKAAKTKAARAGGSKAKKAPAAKSKAVVEVEDEDDEDEVMQDEEELAGNEDAEDPIVDDEDEAREDASAGAVQERESLLGD